MRQYQTVVVQLNNDRSQQHNLFGLTIKSIQGISRILPEQFSSDIDLLPDLLFPYVHNCILPKNQESNQPSDIKDYSFLIDISKLIETKIQT